MACSSSFDDIFGSVDDDDRTLLLSEEEEGDEALKQYLGEEIFRVNNGPLFCNWKVDETKYKKFGWPSFQQWYIHLKNPDSGGSIRLTPYFFKSIGTCKSQPKFLNCPALKYDVGVLLGMLQDNWGQSVTATLHTPRPLNLPPLPAFRKVSKLDYNTFHKTEFLPPNLDPPPELMLVPNEV